MVAMNVNTNTYAVDINTTAQSVVLSPQETNCTSLIIDNPSTTAGIFVVSGKAQPTAALPAEGSSANGKYIGPGKTQLFTKNSDHGFLSIVASAIDANATVYVAIGAGE